MAQLSNPASAWGLLASQINWLDPAWAVLCGVVASGSSGWPSQSEDWLRLALLILLVDIGWGVSWAALGRTDWATPLRRWRDWRSGEPVVSPPYTLPGSPGDRASRWLGQLRAWWRDVFRPACGHALAAIAISLLVTVVLGALMGAELLLLSAAALAVMQLGLARERGQGEVVPEWNALVAVAFPWLAGYLAFGPLTLRPVGLTLALASAFTLAWSAVWQATSRWGRVLGVGSQFLATLLLLALDRPLGGGTLLLLLAPQLVLFPWLQRGQPLSWYVRHVRPWLGAAMLVAAWTARVL